MWPSHYCSLNFLSATSLKMHVEKSAFQKSKSGREKTNSSIYCCSRLHAGLWHWMSALVPTDCCLQDSCSFFPSAQCKMATHLERNRLFCTLFHLQANYSHIQSSHTTGMCLVCCKTCRFWTNDTNIFFLVLACWVCEHISQEFHQCHSKPFPLYCRLEVIDNFRV